MSLPMYNPMLQPCRECGVEPGQLHERHCSIEQCSRCGRLPNSHFHSVYCELSDEDECGPVPDEERIPWTGEWTGLGDCRRLGLYYNPGWDPDLLCEPDEPGADLNIGFLYKHGIWDPSAKRFSINPKKVTRARKSYAKLRESLAVKTEGIKSYSELCERISIMAEKTAGKRSR